LGNYATEEKAAEVYNTKALEIYGTDARVNIIE
jgi:hypothetical protein